MAPREPSRCTNPTNSNYMHLFTDGTDGGNRRRVVYDELGELFMTLAKAGHSQSDLQTLYGEYKALNQRAQDGLLTEGTEGNKKASTDLKPIRKDPEVWELRWPLPHHAPLRQYHAEPTTEPALLLVLKVHLKDLTSADSATISASQNAEIAEARSRYFRGRGDRWGIPHGIDTPLYGP